MLERHGQLVRDELVGLAPQAAPVLEEFKAWMDKRIGQILPKGLLGQALNYALRQMARAHPLSGKQPHLAP